MIKKAGNAFKLLIVIVKKNLSREVIQACKDGGAEGGTVVTGRGTGTNEQGTILGIRFEPEKDIILCLSPSHILDAVITEVTRAASLDEPGTGIAFVVDSQNISGIAHLLKNPTKSIEKNIMDEKDQIEFKLIITIVDKGHCGSVVDASKKAGAEGGTIITGRGSGVHEKAKLLSFFIEPEKEIVLTLVPKARTETVLDAIVEASELNEPGRGIAFTIDIEKVTGINHLIE